MDSIFMARHYDLVLMLDPEAEDGARDGVADEARKLIESGAELEHSDGWGLRTLAYEIRQRNEADYRYFRFSTEDTELLNRLDHSLKIADGVLRFRIFRVEPSTPTGAPPSSDRPTAVAGDRERERR
jgi:small subunit ribosomal protein S6